MGLDHVRKVYEQLGRDDPLYAVLSDDRYRGNRWDPEAFFRTGRDEIRALLDYIDSLNWTLARERALDFGCGVGRLTQALADHFAEVTGIDISSTMIDAARTHDRHGGRVRYLLNTTPDLAQLPDGTFDLVYSNITLQHIPPGHAATYIREFLRVLTPGGLAIFQLRNGPRIRPHTLRAWLYSLRRQHLRRLFKRIRGRPAWEMHFLARSQVEELVEQSRGRMVDVADVSRGRRNRSLRYCATITGREPAVPASGS